MTPDSLRETLLALPMRERAKLAHVLLESLDESADDDAEAAWNTELQYRADEIRAGRRKDR